jgi:hypothetical protein
VVGFQREKQGMMAFVCTVVGISTLQFSTGFHFYMCIEFNNYVYAFDALQMLVRPILREVFVYSCYQFDA